ncbi:DUF2612 domain-containing protein [Shimwellia pseudoproteus]|uniref:DUF2612 domain-containing protein n=1 Tax=Shimwellia pseudoproteus TaxID=570012 RepID=UPI0018ED0107|nr:DUF2612 domain-containing protein [Shimwellia pseudoproteus]MBJ3816653.1 DUF2612 domain-containing protein [Shimwellia pseudoproteus]
MSKYTSLITSYHSSKPLFNQHIDLSTRPVSDIAKTTIALVNGFDLDKAVGMQLDMVGEWIGRSREITAPVDNYFFSLDIPELGFDYGTWKDRYDPVTGIVRVGDDDYRTMLRAKIGANNWKGTSEELPALFNSIYPGGSIKVTYSDNQDMTMTVFVSGDVISPVTKEIIRQGYLAIKPSGVSVTYQINGVAI